VRAGSSGRMGGGRGERDRFELTGAVRKGRAPPGEGGPPPPPLGKMGPRCGAPPQASRGAPSGGAGRVRTRERHVDEFLQHLLNAVMLGGTYALLGIGLTLIFGIMRVVNFAHGELYAFGAYAVYLVVAALGLNFFLGLVVAVIA